MVQWLALSHHSKQVLSSNLGSVAFTCSCYACVGPLWALLLPLSLFKVLHVRLA